MVRSRRRAERQIRFLSLIVIYLCCIWFALVLLQIAMRQSTTTSPNVLTDDSSTISRTNIEEQLIENLSVLDRRSDTESRIGLASPVSIVWCTGVIGDQNEKWRPRLIARSCQRVALLLSLLILCLLSIFACSLNHLEEMRFCSESMLL